MEHAKISLEAWYSGIRKSALGRLRQGDHEPETSLSNIIRSCPTNLLS